MQGPRTRLLACLPAWPSIAAAPTTCAAQCRLPPPARPTYLPLHLQDAESDTAGVAQELAVASTSKKEAEAAAKEAGALLATADKALRAALAEAAPKPARK